MRALKQLVCAGAACAYLVTVSACASHRPMGTHRTEVEHDAVVTVEAIDVPNRLVTVRTASGDPLTVYVNKSNKHFPQASVGDQVRIHYVESFALRLTKANAGEMQIKEETSRPQPGRPAAKTSTEVTATVRIESVKSDGSGATFTGPRGRRTVEIHDAAMRDYVRNLKPGDHVEATYEEALALTLEKVAR